jgi:pre-mRNA-splicing helicase BRR2
LKGVSHWHYSNGLSELVESSLADLEASKPVAIEDNIQMSQSSILGMIAAYYYIS